MRKRNFTFWQLMHNESADVELQIFGSQGRAEMRKRNIRSLAVKTEKCESGISDFQPSTQSGSAVKHFDSPVKLDMRKQILTALTGFEGRIWDLIVSVPDHCLSFYFPYPTDCHCQC